MKYFVAIFLFFAVAFAYNWAALTCNQLGQITVAQAQQITCQEWSQLPDNKIHCLNQDTDCWVTEHCWDYLSANEQALFLQYCPILQGGGGSTPPGTTR
jgi:hypothetical protein